MKALAVLLLSAVFTPALAADARDELARYVATPDPSYAWREIRSRRLDECDVSELVLQSHTWRGVAWKHQLIVIRPANVDPAAKQAFFFIHGGRWGPGYEEGTKPIPRQARLFTALAQKVRAPVAVLRHVPFQPLFDRREDALIAYTFDQYLKTGEADWPLLLPMVKSATRGMDAVQEFVRRRWDIPIERFTVAGASKRGWTSWLTAAIDPRVASVAPMAIDMLNIPAQMELQRATFGGLSEEVQDYADINLPERIHSDLGHRLLEIVDPFQYRERLRQPKLILLGTNDRYWPLDSLKLYWRDLQEPKRVLYIPNQGHGVADVRRLLGSLSALHRYSARGESLPRLSWTFSPRPAGVGLTLSVDRAPRSVFAWTAMSASRDFREARWRAQRCKRGRDGTFQCRSTAVKPGRYTALYAEATFRDRGEPDFSLSTAVCIAGGPQGNEPDC